MPPRGRGTPGRGTSPGRRSTGRRRARRRTRRRMRRRVVVGGMVVMGIGYSAYKLTQSQTDQVEAHSGKKVEDMEEEEFEQALEDLGIEPQDPTDEEMAILEAE